MCIIRYNIIELKEVNSIMLEELDVLIIFIEQEYKRLSNKRKKSDLYEEINQKKKLVKDIEHDNNILTTILNYRLFINENHLDIKLEFNRLNLKSEVNSRVKAQNSIEYKISNYMTNKHNYGEIPLNKCFNDLYGIRIIFEENIDFNDIKKFVDNKYNGKIKCYDASKGDYVATHMYFKENNYSFQWELQIWDKKHYESNIISHENYKQGYTKWEEENKGGESF